MKRTEQKRKDGARQDRLASQADPRKIVSNYFNNEMLNCALVYLLGRQESVRMDRLVRNLAREHDEYTAKQWRVLPGLLLDDERVRIDEQAETVSLNLSAWPIRSGVVTVAAHEAPVIVDDETGDRLPMHPADLSLVLPGDRVSYFGLQTQEISACRLLQVTAHALKEIIGEVRLIDSKKKGMTAVLRKYDARLSYLKVKLDDSMEQLKDIAGQPVCMKLTQYAQEQDPHVHVAFSHVMDKTGPASMEIELAVRLFDLPHEFSDETIHESEALPDKVMAKDRHRRVDLRDIAFCTIDGEDARDFDDAVYAEKIDDEQTRLVVAIADVSHYVKPGQPLDADAQLRCTSVYFPRRVIPMLPEKLSNGLCSLNPHQERCAMVCDMVIDAKGEVSAYQFYPALIESQARLTYTQVWAALQGDPEACESLSGMNERILVLYELYQRLRAARNKRGAIDFYARETYVQTDDEGNITGIKPREITDAHRLIEECMLAANTCAADFIAQGKKQCLYRVHDKPSEVKLNQLRETLSGFGVQLGGGDEPTPKDYDAVLRATRDMPNAETIQMALLRSMQRAVYSPENVGHYGLSYPCYTHFTSPIRRYPDLLVHRTIRAMLASRTYRPEITPQALWVLGSASGGATERSLRAREHGTVKASGESGVWDQLGKITSACERRADDASRDVTAWLKCRYMKTHAKPGQQFDARITAVTSFGIFVELQDIFVEGFVHISRLGWDYYVYTKQGTLKGQSGGDEFRMGDHVRVELYEVDEDKRRIDFVLARKNAE